MSGDFRILSVQDIESILRFERNQLEKIHGESPEATFAEWSARWRQEQLEHYLKLGWSLGVFKNGDLAAYLLAQPFVFFQGITQTLWVEYMSCSNKLDGMTLLDSIVRYSKEKHLQRVLVEESIVSEFELAGFKNRAVVFKAVEFLTTKGPT
ncbi:MAG: hypothetical protein COT74_05895 [Bdellovibrionales bacterium CG10_big_fil_rev_8_21_14_0_10_45_34]|nr:MAG: hypothetical protein COT74_05895 [Bdellovibrionales bacterium CG10_big_fil_rev_8_21_14_0_10_45_34]